MRLDKIHIKNLKSIRPELTINFERRKHITLLYGHNGAGKTTVLEAISLLGHVSTMRRFYVDDEPAPSGQRQGPELAGSYFREVLGRLGAERPDLGKDDLESIASLAPPPPPSFSTPPPSAALEPGEPSQRRDRLSKPPDPFEPVLRVIDAKGLRRWFEEATGREPDLPRLGLVKYTLHLEQNEEPQLEFVIVFLQEHGQSITHALSRDAGDDLAMEAHFAVVACKSEKSKVNRYIAGLHDASPHILEDGGGSERLIPRREQRPTYGIVSYINTDLNNFGKKNDMRESVKNLRRHFTQEIKERFGIPFNGVPSGDHRGDCLNHNLQEELNGVLGRILHGAGGAGPTFKIEHCRLDGKKLHLGAKHPNGETLSLDFMSAGENECFFIFLLLLGMNIKNSIILLDEPDLHMNHSAKEVFFRELLDRLQKEDCQVVLSTHSMDAYTRGASMDRQMIRLDRDAKGEVLYTCDWKDIYDVEFQDRAWRTSIRSLRRLGLVSGLRLARREIFLLYDEWFRRFDPRTSAGILERMTFIAQRAGAVIGVLLLVILTICGLIAFGWDALTVVDHAFASEHTDKLWPIHRFCVLLSIGLVGWYHLRLWWRADRARTSA